MNAHLRAALAFLLSVGCSDGASGTGKVTGGAAGQAAGANQAGTGASAVVGGAGAGAGGVGGSVSASGGESAGGVNAGGATQGGVSNGGAAGSASTGGGSAGGGSAGAANGVLYVAGEMPLVGVDLQLHEVLKSLNLAVEDVRETATPARASGKRLVVLSYSMSSNDFKAEDWADVPVPIIVLEHYLLPRLGMTTEANHGYHDGVTQLQLVADEPLMTAGMPKGNVTVYTKTGEFFWGIPTAQAVTIATVVGSPAEPVTFGYPAGSMMAGRVAPARRVQAFVAVHAPPPNPAETLSADGLKLFGGCVTWAIQ